MYFGKRINGETARTASAHHVSYIMGPEIKP